MQVQVQSNLHIRVQVFKIISRGTEARSHWRGMYPSHWEGGTPKSGNRLWRPLLPYECSYKASCARPD